MSSMAENNYLCSICRSLHQKYSRCCNLCNGVFSIVKIPHSMSHQFVKTKKKNVASKILEKKVKVKPIEGYEFLGEMPSKFNCMVYGEPGSGKSYFGLGFADTIAKLKKKKTIYFTSEEETSNRDLQKKLIDCQISDELFIESVKKEKDFRKILENDYGYKSNIFLDSVTSLKLSPEKVKEYSEKIKGIFVFTIHVNKKGNYRGSTAYKHDTQVEIKVSEGIAKTGKNRLGTSGGTYDIFERINDDKQD